MSIRRLFGDGTGRLRTVWRFLLFVIAEAVMLLAAQVTFIFAAVFLLPQSVREAFAKLPFLEMLAIAPVWVAGNLGIVFLFRMLLDRRSVVSVGLGPPQGGRATSPQAGLGLGVAAATLPIILLLGAGALRIGGLGGSAATALVVPALIVSAFNEELVFRGYLLRNMLDVGRPVWGVLLTSLLFTLAHLANPHFLDSPLGAANVFLSGVALALAYVAAGDIWFPTALHFGWNAGQGLLFDIPVSGLPLHGLLRLEAAEGAGRLLTGGEFGLEGSATATASTFALILVLLALLRRRRRRARRAEGTLTEPPGNS